MLTLFGFYIILIFYILIPLRLNSSFATVYDDKLNNKEKYTKKL